MARPPRRQQDLAVAAVSQRERHPVPSDDFSAEVPDRLYFRIGEVSAITGVPPYVLRYWESEFSSLQPRKSGGGQRLKRLLYQERYTVAGARRRLMEREDRARRGEIRATIQRLKSEMEDVIKRLS
jgi:MerR HTH family regulatory protein